MQQVLDNPFLLLFPGVAVPTEIYLTGEVMEIVATRIGKWNSWPNTAQRCRGLPSCCAGAVLGQRLFVALAARAWHPRCRCYTLFARHSTRAGCGLGVHVVEPADNPTQGRQA